MIKLFRTFLSLLFCLFALFSTGQELYLPAIDSNKQCIEHYGFVIQYNEDYEQADWVAYELTANECIPIVKRSNYFREDPKVETGSATDEDYQGSGYDRGHMAPVADMAWSLRSMQESFFYSNMSPQHPSFNRGIWKKLEAQVRHWAMEYKRIQVVSGSIVDSPHVQIGPNQMAIPQFYYKALLIKKDSGYLSLAFLLPHQKSNAALKTFILSVNELELRSAVDFFPLLNDTIENEVESQSDPDLWDWEVRYDFEKEIEKSSVRRCVGITKSGKQCKRTTTDQSQKCWQHQ